MDSPSIDSLLENVPSIFALAAVAGKRAVEIKKTDRENKQPLQQALDEICDGEVNVAFKKPISDDAADGEQIELPLEIETEKVKLENASVTEIVEQSDDDEDEKTPPTEEVEEIAPEVGVLEEDYPPKIIKGEFKLNEDE